MIDYIVFYMYISVRLSYCTNNGIHLVISRILRRGSVLFVCSWITPWLPRSPYCLQRSHLRARSLWNGLMDRIGRLGPIVIVALFGGNEVRVVFFCFGESYFERKIILI